MVLKFQQGQGYQIRALQLRVPLKLFDGCFLVGNGVWFGRFGVAGLGFLALARAVHQLFNAGLETAGAIGEKGQFGYVTDAHALF